MDTRTCPDEYVWSQEFEDNLKKQAEFVETYKRMKSPWSYSPYHEWNDFLERYTHFRACLASLRNNPDTKDDADFKELCEMWNHYKDSFHPRIGINYKELENRYYKLRKKPVFDHNPFFREMYGAFVKSVHQLLAENVYWQPFFDID